MPSDDSTPDDRPGEADDAGDRSDDVLRLRVLQAVQAVQRKQRDKKSVTIAAAADGLMARPFGDAP
jgi:hypothetical protein